MATFTLSQLRARDFMLEKHKTPDLSRIRQLFAAPPADGLAGWLKPESLRHFAPQCAGHAYCIYVKLGEAKIHTTMLLVALRMRTSGSLTPPAPWVDDALFSDSVIATLEAQNPWLTDELLLALQSFLDTDMLARPTVAPQQLLLQWYIGQLVNAFTLFGDLEISEDDVKQVEELFTAGQEILAGQRQHKAAAR